MISDECGDLRGVVVRKAQPAADLLGHAGSHLYVLVEANSADISDLGAAVDTAVALGANAVSNSYYAPEYNGELSRILYAFSCFEKEVSYAADSNEYTIQLHFSSKDSEYVLSKTRFLGKRVRIIDGEHLRRRMLESATKSLARYAQFDEKFYLE